MTPDIITPEITDEPVQLAEIVKSSPLEKTQGQKYLQLFTPYFNRMADIEKKIALLNVADPGKTDIKIAREIRLALKDNRVDAEKIKDKEKASVLIEGRLIDSLFGVVNNSSKALELKCADIEKVAEIKEAKRKEELKQERIELLTPYELDLTGYDLGAMTQGTFDQLLENTKAGYEKRLEDKRKEEELRVQIEAAKRLHEKRKQMLLPVWQFVSDSLRSADFSVFNTLEFDAITRDANNAQIQHDADQQRIKDENERLKKEQETKGKRNDELRPFIMFIRDYNAMLALPEDEYLKELADVKRGAYDYWEYERKESLRKQKEEEDKEAALELERKKSQKELKDKQAALDKIEADKKTELLAKKKAERAPDKEKLEKLAASIAIYELPNVKSVEAVAITSNVKALLNKIVTYLNQQIETL